MLCPPTAATGESLPSARMITVARIVNATADARHTTP
jgi:hypothetical protein